MTEIWKYSTMTKPTDSELNTAGKNGWEVYATDGKTFLLKKRVVKRGI